MEHDVDYTRTSKVYAGLRYSGVMPCSEVCMHMRIAGKVMDFEVLPGSRMAQLYRDDGSLFSFPITTGEAGIYDDGNGGMYYHPPVGISGDGRTTITLVTSEYFTA